MTKKPLNYRTARNIRQQQSASRGQTANTPQSLSATASGTTPNAGPSLLSASPGNTPTFTKPTRPTLPRGNSGGNNDKREELATILRATVEQLRSMGLARVGVGSESGDTIIRLPGDEWDGLELR